nr:MAG TPA: hypothetical protein [Caudoviricetes sp.]
MRVVITSAILARQNRTILNIKAVVLQVLPTQAVGITILLMKTNLVRMTYTTKIALRLVQMVRSQYGKVSLVIGKSLTEMVMV